MAGTLAEANCGRSTPGERESILIIPTVLQQRFTVVYVRHGRNSTLLRSALLSRISAGGWKPRARWHASEILPFQLMLKSSGMFQLSAWFAAVPRLILIIYYQRRFAPIATLSSATLTSCWIPNFENTSRINGEFLVPFVRNFHSLGTWRDFLLKFGQTSNFTDAKHF